MDIDGTLLCARICRAGSFDPQKNSEKKAKEAQPILRGYKMDPTHPFHHFGDFVLVQILEEEDRWLGLWANYDVTWEVPIRDLIPMNHPLGGAMRKAFS